MELQRLRCEGVEQVSAPMSTWLNALRHRLPASAMLLVPVVPARSAFVQVREPLSFVLLPRYVGGLPGHVAMLHSLCLSLLRHEIVALRRLRLQWWQSTD